jgi:DNA-binding MarR family transcriptional regulator
MDLAQLATALEIAGSVDPGGLYVHHLQILVTIREAGPAGCSYRTIEERHGLSNASASRSVNALSDNARHRKTSMGLVEIRRDPTEGRRYVVVLTKKGEALMRSIEQL